MKFLASIPGLAFAVFATGCGGSDASTNGGGGAGSTTESGASTTTADAGGSTSTGGGVICPSPTGDTSAKGPCPSALTGMTGLSAVAAAHDFAQASLKAVDLVAHQHGVDRALTRLEAEKVSFDGKGAWEIQFCSGLGLASSTRLTFQGNQPSCEFECEGYITDCAELAATIDTDVAIKSAFPDAAPGDEFKVALGQGVWNVTRTAGGPGGFQKTPAK
jgi:hypothetical protein